MKTTLDTLQSDSIVFSSAGGDGLGDLGNQGANQNRVWSSIGDDYHRLLTLQSYLEDIEYYEKVIILTDQVEFLTSSTLDEYLFTDDDDLYIPDDLYDILEEPGGSISEVDTYPYLPNEIAIDQPWYFEMMNTNGPTALIFLSENINTNVDFVDRVIGGASISYDLDLFFSH